jgi:hypothetical protein
VRTRVGRAGLHQVDRAAAPEVVPLAVARPVLLVRAPTELGRLRALAHEAVHRPGVDELAELLRLTPDLRVALGDVDHLHAELLRQPPPLLAGRGLGGVQSEIAGQVEQGLLDEMRNQARVGAVRKHRRRAGFSVAQRQRVLAQ